MQYGKQNGSSRHSSYGFSAHGAYNSKIVVCYSQTMHKMDFLKGHRPGQR